MLKQYFDWLIIFGRPWYENFVIRKRTLRIRFNAWDAIILHFSSSHIAGIRFITMNFLPTKATAAAFFKNAALQQQKSILFKTDKGVQWGNKSFAKVVMAFFDWTLISRQTKKLFFPESATSKKKRKKVEAQIL